MEPFHFQVDKQVLTQIKISKWSNLVCIGLLAYITISDFVRAQKPDYDGISPEIVLMITFFLAVYFMIRFFEARRSANQVINVHLTVTEDTAEGVCVSRAMARDREFPNGRPFKIGLEEITGISIGSSQILKRETTPTLIIECGENLYQLPGLDQPDQAKLVLQRLSAQKN